MDIQPLWQSLDGIEQLCKVALEDIQNCFDIKEDLWEKYVVKEIKQNKPLMTLIETRQDNFDWEKQTPLGGAGTTLNGIVLYCLARVWDMHWIIETGVSGGFYTSFLIEGLQANLNYPTLHSLELSDDMTQVGKLIPKETREKTLRNDEVNENVDWYLITGKSSLDYFKEVRAKNQTHCADLYSHDSLHTMAHMMKELNEFKQSTSEDFFIFIDDEKSDGFWDKCLQMGAFKKPGYKISAISGKESRLKGHLGGFVKYSKIK